MLAQYPSEASSFNGVQLFFATRFAERQVLGETVTAWIASHAHYKIHDITVLQSSDAAFHCVTVVVFYLEDSSARSAVSAEPTMSTVISSS